MQNSTSLRRKLKKTAHITEDLYKTLFITASAPEQLYGTAKIHNQTDRYAQ